MLDLDENGNEISPTSACLNLNKPDPLKENQSTAESTNNLENSKTSPTSSNSGILNREKRVRKQKKYDDDFVLFDVISSSNRKNANKIAIDKNHQQALTAPELNLENQENISETLTDDVDKSANSTTKYNIGDLVWAKLSGHPWWPCMVSNSPNNQNSNESQETSTFANNLSHVKYIGTTRQKCSYYVLFFGPSLEHAWVGESCLIEYKGIEAFKSYAQNLVDQASTKSRKERFSEKFQLKIASSRKEQWDQGVREADFALSKLISERKLYFLKKYSDKQKKKRDLEDNDDSEEGSANFKRRRSSTSSNPTDDSRNNSKTRPAYENKSNAETDENSQASVLKVINPRVLRKRTNQEVVPEDVQSKKFKTEEIDSHSKKNLISINDCEEENKENINTSKPLPSENAGNNEINNEKKLRLIKNRLTALTCIDNNLLSIDVIAHHYQINKSLLMFEYFGFNDVDEENIIAPSDKEEFLKNLELVKIDLEKKIKEVIESSKNSALNQDNSIADDPNLETVPKALVAFKLKMPMVYVNKISEYLKAIKESEKLAEQNKTDIDCKTNIESSNSSLNKFYNYLFDLSKKLFANRKNIIALNDILNENKFKI